MEPQRTAARTEFDDRDRDERAPLPDTYLLVDQEAFERLYQQHRHAVRDYVRRRQQPDDVDEALSEIWLVAWRRRSELPAEPLPWLYGIARRVLANQRRGRARLMALRLRLGQQPAPTAVVALTDGRLREALQRLAPLDREALLLTSWEGLAPSAAARALGCSESAFRSRLRRARGRLERELGASDEEACSTAVVEAS